MSDRNQAELEADDGLWRVTAVLALVAVLALIAWRKL